MWLRICAILVSAALAASSASGQEPVMCSDVDADGVCDVDDNCLVFPNAGQFDSNLDGYGNVCDADYDDDGWVTLRDTLAIRDSLYSVSGDMAYESAFDVNHDGAIAFIDFWISLLYLGRRPGPSGLSCAGHVPCLPPARGPLSVLAIGDSITAGGDDEPVPADSCADFPGGGFGGWPDLLQCHIPDATWFRHAAGGWTSYNALVHLDQVLDAFPQGNIATVSLHVNDGAPAGCGSVCDGGARDALPCITDVDCTGGACDSTVAHACSAADTRRNIQTIVDSLLDRGYERVIFWRTPGAVGAGERNHPLALAQFDGTASAIDSLFQVGTGDSDYANDRRVVYLDAAYLSFCPGSGVLDCGPSDGIGDRRSWWFAHDEPSFRRHIHPNAWGYMELGRILGEAIIGQPLNQRPGRPLVFASPASDSEVSVVMDPLPDPDGDSLTLYAWAVEEGRECGAIPAADHDGDGYRDLMAVAGEAVLAGLKPETAYRICGVAYDGFQGSWFNDDSVVTTLPADSDADQLPDRVETNTGRFVCSLDTGTDPQDPDTDSDGWADGVEVALGTDPTSSLSRPTGATP
jgi:hypothetical protein